MNDEHLYYCNDCENVSDAYFATIVEMVGLFPHGWSMKCMKCGGTNLREHRENKGVNNE